MTISTTDSSISYSGNGVTLAFAVPFRFLVNGDIVAVLRSTAGVETTQILDTNYTLTGADDDAGGTLTMIVAPASGEKLVIRRVVGITQETDYISGDSFPAESHERALDRLTMIGQQHEESLGRSLQFPVSDTASAVIPTSASRANKFLAFDADGNASVSSATDPGSVTFSTLGETLVGRGTAALMRGDIGAAVSGVNGDITSLSDPTIIVEQLQTSASSKVATTLWVDRRLWGDVRQSIVFSQNLNDTTGAPDWGGSTGGTSLTASHGVTYFSCGGFLVDINGSRASSTWTGLSAVSTTYYLYFEIDPTTNNTSVGSTTLVPGYSQGDLASTTSGQHTFIIPDMTMRLGDGASSSTVYRVFVGEATTGGGGTVTSFIWYNIRGQYYDSARVFTTSAAYTINHNLGLGGPMLEVDAYITPISTTENGYSPLSAASPDWVNIGSNRDITFSTKGRNQIVVSTSNSINIVPAAGGAPVAITPANWYLYVTVKRKW
jgi:hypothetical protein